MMAFYIASDYIASGAGAYSAIFVDVDGYNVNSGTGEITDKTWTNSGFYEIDADKFTAGYGSGTLTNVKNTIVAGTKYGIVADTNNIWVIISGSKVPYEAWGSGTYYGVSGDGTANRLVKWIDTSEIEDSVLWEDGTNLFIQSGAFSGVTAVYWDINANTPPVHTEGAMWYDEGNKALAVWVDEPDVTLQLGQEIWARARNTTGTTIADGAPVYVSGALGNKPLISLAVATSGTELEHYVLGLATHSIEDVSNGFVTSFGIVRGLNTTGTPVSETWVTGDELYLSPTTAGILTNIKPNSPDFVVLIGVVLYAHVTQGEIMVDIREIPSGAHHYVDFEEDSGVPSHREGRMFYDYDAHAFATYVSEPDITLQIGQEMWARIYNDTGATINNGQVVRPSGIHTDGVTVEVILANSSTLFGSYAVGIATHDIEDQSFGFITIGGRVHNINTSGFAAGSVLYASDITSGSYTTTRPTDPSYATVIGLVVKEDASDGIIHAWLEHRGKGFGTSNQVRAMGSAGVEEEYKTLTLNYLDDVDAVATDGYYLAYDSASGAWVASGADGGGGVTDHGALTGLADDDHPQYGALAQNETVGGIWTHSAKLNANAALRIGGTAVDPASDSYVNLGVSSAGMRLYTNYGLFDVGPRNASWCHFSTDRDNFYFYKGMSVLGHILPATDSIYNLGYPSKRFNNLYIDGSVHDGSYGYNLHDADGVGSTNKHKMVIDLCGQTSAGYYDDWYIQGSTCTISNTGAQDFIAIGTLKAPTNKGASLQMWLYNIYISITDGDNSDKLDRIYIYGHSGGTSTLLDSATSLNTYTPYTYNIRALIGWITTDVSSYDFVQLRLDFICTNANELNVKFPIAEYYYQ
jgi:hypothetical protein